jgi:hypothetical protein
MVSKKNSEVQEGAFDINEHDVVEIERGQVLPCVQAQRTWGACSMAPSAKAATLKLTSNLLRQILIRSS